MKTNIFIAFKSSNKLSSTFINSKVNQIKEYYNLQNQKILNQSVNIQIKTKIYNNFGIIFISCIDTHQSINLWQENNNVTAISVHLPLGIQNIIPNFHKDINNSLLLLSTKLNDDPKQMSNMNGPSIFSYITKSKLVLFNDKLGFGRLYEYTTDNITVWSNKIACAIIFSNKCPTLSIPNLYIYSVTGYCLENYTVYDNIILHPYGTYITVTSNNIKLNRYYSISENKPITINQIDNNFKQFFNQLHYFITDKTKLKIGLSGGRDSRTVASYLTLQTLKLNKKQLFLHTAYPPVGELAVAEKCIKSSNLISNWSKLKRKEPINTNVYKKYYNYVKLYGGDIKPFISNYISLDNILIPFSHSAINISGVGGEFLRIQWKYKCNTNDFNCIYDKINTKLFTLNKYNKSLYPSHIKSILDSMINHYKNSKNDTNNFFNYLYLSQLYRRWAGGLHEMNTISPFYNAEILNLIFNIPNKTKINHTITETLTNKNCPQWKNILYLDQIQKQERKKLDINEYNKKYDKVSSTSYIYDTNEDKDILLKILNTSPLIQSLYNHNDIIDDLTHLDLLSESKKISLHIILCKTITIKCIEDNLNNIKLKYTV